MADAVGATPKETDATTDANGLAVALRAEEVARAAVLAARLEVGRALRETREAAGVGLCALADAAGVDRANLSRVERGRMWTRPLVERAVAALEILTHSEAT